MSVISSVLNSSSPFSDPVTWDTLTVSGSTWAGKFVINGAARAYKWQVKFGAGNEGAQETYRGKNPTKFEIDFYIWTDAQYKLWLEFSKLFLYTGTKTNVKPVEIFHPSLELLSITQIVCEEIGAVEKVSDDLMFRAKVKLREFFPPLPKNATQSPLGASVTKPRIPGLKPDPVADRLNAQITQQYNQAISNGLLHGLPR